MAHAVPLHNVLRDDVPSSPLPLEQTLQNAPETDGSFFARTPIYQPGLCGVLRGARVMWSRYLPKRVGFALAKP